jgi:hypothetical protein
MIYALSIMLIVVSNVCYNITQKSTPSASSPFAALLVTYLTAGFITFGALLITRVKSGLSLSGSFHGINWTSVVLGLAIIGLELGYLLAYRAGWEIGRASLIANIALALILLPVGIFFYGEAFSLTKLAGVGLCGAGLFLLNR